jgi:hypothetical protein
MSEAKHYTLVRQRFLGVRFEDHGLDLDVVPELLLFKTLIIEVAKDLWRKKNPGTERLTGNFEDRFQVKMFAIQGGSVTVPFERLYVSPEDSFAMIPSEDEFDEAVDLITQSINAVNGGNRLPSGISRRVLPYFAQLSDHLLADETMIFLAGRSSKESQFSGLTKKLFKNRIAADFEDEVVLRGELRSVNLDNRMFTLRMDDETKVLGKFSDDQEPLVTGALRDHSTSRVEIHGTALFEGSTGDLSRIERVSSLEILPVSATSSQRRPIWEVADDIGKTIPEEEWDQLPEDASSNLNHYLYGSGRKSE